MSELQKITEATLTEVRAGLTSPASIWWDETTRIGDMADSHLKNAALKLLGFGNDVYDAEEVQVEIWFQLLRLEWQRRLRERRVDKGIREAQDKS